MQQENLEDLPKRQRVSAENHHACRPLCPCCGGGDNRKGYKHTKATSRYHSAKSRRSKPKKKDHQ
jgi:hypothetical protein